VKISRRGFLGTSAALAGGAFVIGFHLNAAAQDTAGKVESGANPFDAWVHIKPDSSAELVLAQSEMGQGVYTSLPMLLAEEADLDWERVTVKQSDSTKGTGGNWTPGSGPLPQPRMMVMEATIFTGWIYDHLLPHADSVKVAHPLMLRAIAAPRMQ
jgi:isoquinoline 1-oxidoreductase beta subunit